MTLLRTGLALAIAFACCACAKSDEDWLAELGDRDPFVRAMAAIALCEQAPERARPALPVLLETVDRVEVGLGPVAARGLAKIGPWAGPDLVANLVGGEFLTLERKDALANALVAAGPAGAAAIVAALRAQAREDPGELGALLVRIGGGSVPVLVELLAETRHPELADYAAFLLERIGPSARGALPALRAALEHPDPSVQRSARAAIAGIERAASATERGPVLRGP